MIGKDTGQDASSSKSETSFRDREVDFALSIVLHTSMDEGNWAGWSGAARLDLLSVYHRFTLAKLGQVSSLCGLYGGADGCLSGGLEVGRGEIIEIKWQIPLLHS